MIFRNLDTNNDWTFGKGQNNFAQRNNAISLNIKTKILSWLDDCFFDRQMGIDWLNRLGKTNQVSLLEDDLRRIISQAENVTSINSIDVTIINRDFNVSFDISTIYSKSFQDSINTGV